MFEVDGTEVKDVAAMEALFSEMKPGDEIEIKVRRGDGVEKVPVTLGER